MIALGIGLRGLRIVRKMSTKSAGWLIRFDSIALRVL